MTKNKYVKILCLSLLFGSLTCCSPKLNYTEIKERINADYSAFNEGNIDYELQNIPKKYVKEYGEKGLKEKLHRIYSNRTNPLNFGEIGELRIQERNKCNSIYYYKTKFTVDKIEFTPYLDETVLERNYKSYGKENVSFNSNSKMLQI